MTRLMTRLLTGLMTRLLTGMHIDLHGSEISDFFRDQKGALNAFLLCSGNNSQTSGDSQVAVIDRNAVVILASADMQRIFRKPEP